MKITSLLFWTGLVLMLIVGVMAISQANAAQTPVGTITTPSTGQTTLKAYNDNYVNPKLTIIGGNFDDIAANKADKAQSIRYWADHANGTTLAVGTIVAYEGKLYNTTQEFLKTSGATPVGFSAYFSEVAGGSGGTTYTAGTGITITDGVIASTVTDTDTFASWDKDYNDLINAPTGGSMTWPSSAGIAVYGGSDTWGTSIAASSLLVGDATAGPFFDGTIDGGTTLKFYGPNGYWQALQAGASTANRSWRLMIGAPPAAGTTTLLNVDEYGQMGQVATSTYLTPSGVGGALTVTATGFNGNLTPTDNTIQEIAQKFDDYTGGGSMTWPAAAGIMVYGGSNAFGTSLVADGDAIGEVVVVQDDGAGNPSLPFTLDISALTDTTEILTGKLSVSAIDDVPVNGETAAPISSNWANDHTANATAHGTFQAADADLDDLADGTLTGLKVSSSSDTAVGVIEIATTAETTTGTSATLAVTPDGLSGSVYGAKEIGWAVINSDTVTAVANGKQAAVIPASMNGMNLVDLTCSVHDLNSAASGTTTIVLRRVRGETAANMTSTGVTIDYNAYTASDETVDTTNDDLATGDKLYVDVNAITTAAQKGLSCTALFQTP